MKPSTSVGRMVLPLRCACAHEVIDATAPQPPGLSSYCALIREGGMARGEIRPGRGVKADAAPVRTRSTSGERRLPAPVEYTEAPPQAKRSAAMQLAAEVERLERELAAARSQMADLATRADVDPLTDVLNRRGFERE